MKVMLFIMGSIAALIAIYLGVEFPTYSEWIGSKALGYGNTYRKSEVIMAWHVIKISGGAAAIMLGAALWLAVKDMDEGKTNN